MLSEFEIRKNKYSVVRTSIKIHSKGHRNRGKIDARNKNIHDRALSWLQSGTSNKRWRVKLFSLRQLIFNRKIGICPCVRFFWPIYCMSFFKLRLFITTLVSSNVFINFANKVMKRKSLNSDGQQLPRRHQQNETNNDLSP